MNICYVLDSGNHVSMSTRAEILRILTFPNTIPWSQVRALARSGCYFDVTIKCHFCHVSPSVTSQHDCGNHPDNTKLPSDSSNYRFESNRIISFLEVDWSQNVSDSMPLLAFIYLVARPFLLLYLIFILKFELDISIY